MPWFKCWFFQWDTDEVAALDLETTGFLHLLKLRMAERRSPLPEEFLPHVVRGKRLNKRSIERMLKTLIGYGLIVRENGLIWNEDIAEDIDGFFDVPRKFDQSFAKVSPEQRQKTQQNQCDASTEVEVEVEGDREAPEGASRYHVEKDNLGSREPALANASRFPSAEGREDHPSTADLELAALGALEAPRATFDGATIPPPVDDPMRGWVPEHVPAGSEDYADATDDRDDDQRRYRLLLDEILSREAELGDGAMGDQLRRIARGMRRSLAKHGHLSGADVGTISMLVKRLEAADRTKRGGADTVRRSGAKSREAREARR